MDSWGQLSSFKHHVYWLTLWKENDGCWWLLMHRKWMLYSECCQQDFLTLAWLTGLTCPPLDLYIFKHLSISSIICMSSGVLWPQVLISDLPFTVIRVEHFIAMSTSQLPKWPSLFFSFTWFSKIENQGNCTVSGEKGLPPFQIVDDCDLLIKLWFMFMKKVNIGRMQYNQIVLLHFKIFFCVCSSHLAYHMCCVVMFYF